MNLHATSDLGLHGTIRRIDPVRIAVPLARPMKMAGMHIVDADNVLVRIEADDGTVGWGEATVAPTMTGDFAESIVAAVRHLSDLLIGKPIAHHAELARQCLEAVHGNSGAKSAIDMALLDLVGRKAGVPMVELLGGPVRTTAESMWLLGNPTTAEDVDEARAKYEEGFRLFKLKAGVKPIDEDIALARELRQTLPDDAALCTDANMALSVASARRYLSGVADIDLLFFEQPVRAEDLSGMAKLSGLGISPLCADEGILGPQDILAHAHTGAASGVNIKLMKAGGPRAALRMSHLCEALGMSVTVAGKVAETSISTSSTLAVACAGANLDWGINLTHIYLAEDIVREPLRLEKGAFTVPSGPGNGVEIDLDAVERYRVK